MEIIHKSKFLTGTVENNSSTIRSSGRNRTFFISSRLGQRVIYKLKRQVEGNINWNYPPNIKLKGI